MEDRIGPLSNVIGFWDHDLGGYPERIRLAMEDGHIVTYLLDVQQPEPNVIPEYQPRHLKRPAMLQHQPAQDQIFPTTILSQKGRK